ncbi:MAG TPA: knotted carbamoyltransferase YgeW [Spirochaetia bacterium]|nr:knotted carbamoyltransferase YgeW [Spirochaetia bacterium]
MTIKDIGEQIEKLDGRKIAMYGKDFLLTWEKTEDEIRATFLVAEILRGMRQKGITPRLWDSGLAVSIFKDNSTRTRFSYASACNLLGLAVQDFEEKKSQVAHGETVRETATMISFLTEAIGIRDDMYLGEGDRFQREIGDALDDAVKAGVLPQRPAVINLQSDIDHPTQSMADMLHLVNHFGGAKKLKGKKIAMTWAYSPSYGKPLSVPQGIIGLMTRFGMDVTLAYPEGYSLIPETLEVAKRNASKTGGSFAVASSMQDAFADADIVYPKSWAPYAVMQERTELLKAGNEPGLKELEKRCLTNNARYRSWECTEQMMKLTKGGTGLYMHCLPADISGVSCKEGEVAASVFERYRNDTYLEAGYKPYIIAAMILLSRVKDPAAVLGGMLKRKPAR